MLDSVRLILYNAHVELDRKEIEAMSEHGFEDRIRVGSLFEVYGALLTKKQRSCVELYFCEDLSLAEIAEQMQVSRQAVHDLLKRVEQTLEEYEAQLGFLKTTAADAKVLANAKSLLLEAKRTKSVDLVDQVLNLLAELSIEGR